MEIRHSVGFDCLSSRYPSLPWYCISVRRTALSGIIAGIIGGLVVTLFSNSSLGVSGPAAGLVAIVEPAIQQLGFQNFLLAVALAGVFQFLLGMYKAGTIGYYFPTAVIKGMLVAIGLIIILKQIPHAFGYDKDYEGNLAFQQDDGYNTLTEIGHALNLVTPSAVVITIVCLAILILWESKFMKNFSFTKIIQGPLVAVIAGILFFLAFSSTDKMKLESEHLVSLPDSIELTYPHFKPSEVTSTEINFGHGGGEKHDEASEGKEADNTDESESDVNLETDGESESTTPIQQASRTKEATLSKESQNKMLKKMEAGSPRSAQGSASS